MEVDVTEQSANFMLPDNMPHTSELQQYCAIHLKHSNPEMRPKLSAVLLHPFFNHEFVLIHSFLTEVWTVNSFEKFALSSGIPSFSYR